MQHSWYDARDECHLYGGWLLSLGSRQEQNCILKFAQDNVRTDWYWHDGEGASAVNMFKYLHFKRLTVTSEECSSTLLTGRS